MPRSKPSLTDLLQEAALDPKKSVAQIQQQLRDDGVDIDGILKRAAATIGEAVREHHRLSSMAANEGRIQRLADAHKGFATWSVERIQQWLRDVADGRLGVAPQALAQPCFRNRQPGEMTEEELRNLAAEIQAAMPSTDGPESIRS